MFKQIICIWLVLLPGLYGQGAGGDDAAEGKQEEALARATELREVVRQWVKTETLVAREVADWEADQARMRELLAIHRAELQQLDELLAEAGESAADSDEERRQMKADLTRLRTARQGFIKRLQGLKPRALGLVGRFPKPLQERLADATEQVEALDPAETPREFTQALVALVTGAADFNATITTETEIRPVDGRRLELRVLYLGLARAFFVSRDGETAGVGSPGPDGWVWQARPNLAGPVSRAIQVVSKKGRPDFVELPLEVSK